MTRTRAATARFTAVAVGSGRQIGGQINAASCGFQTAKMQDRAQRIEWAKIGDGVRAVEPRDEVKGQAARVTFYMADRYHVRLSDQQQKLFMAWDRLYPVTEWEKERDRRIARAMGHSFVTGEKQWTPGYKPSGAATQLVSIKAQPQKPALQHLNERASSQTVYGTINEAAIGNCVFELPAGVPGRLCGSRRSPCGSGGCPVCREWRRCRPP